MKRVANEKLEEALSLLKAGNSFRECEKLTGVSYKRVEREAKKRGIEKGFLSQLIDDKTRVDAEFVTLCDTDKAVVSQEVTRKLRLAGLILDFNEKAIAKANQLLKTTETGADFKAIVDGVDKVSITANINHRHAKPSNTTIQTNTQVNYAQLNDSDLMRDLKSLRDANSAIDAS